MQANAKDQAIAGRILDSIDPHRERLSTFDMLPHARTLRRAQLTLHRWAELECGTEAGHIEREGDDGEGRPYFVTAYGQRWGLVNKYARRPIPDREQGALARVAAACKASGLYFYHQTDPRGCALYVGGEPLTDANYSQRGVPCL